MTNEVHLLRYAVLSLEPQYLRVRCVSSLGKMTLFRNCLNLGCALSCWVRRSFADCSCCIASALGGWHRCNSLSLGCWLECGLMFKPQQRKGSLHPPDPASWAGVQWNVLPISTPETFSSWVPTFTCVIRWKVLGLYHVLDPDKESLVSWYPLVSGSMVL